MNRLGCVNELKLKKNENKQKNGWIKNEKLLF